jgi:RNase P subunit RPR2
MGRRRHRSNAATRKERGLAAQTHLAGILEAPHRYPEVVVASAAVHLMKTSQRHRLSLTQTGRERVCRKCWAPHTQAAQFRVRIRGGMRVRTCLKCGSVRRFGGGPKHHRVGGGEPGV